AELELVKGGSGEPLLVLHDEMGQPGWLRYHDSLARRRTLLMPSHPGFGGSPRLDWIMNVRDLAGFYLAALEDLGYGPVDVVGHSFGGWVAAAMASMCPHQFGRLVLVAPVGIRPPQGEIFDMYLVTTQMYIENCFHDRENTPEFATLYGGAEATP